MTANIFNASPRISSLAAELLAELGASANASPHGKQYFVVLLGESPQSGRFVVTCNECIRSIHVVRLRALSFSQDRPHRLSEPGSHALQGGEPQVPPALFDEPVLSPVHFNMVGKRLLAPVLCLPMAANDAADTLWQRRAGAFHARYFTVGYLLRQP